MTFEKLKEDVKEIDFDKFQPQDVDFGQVVKNISENLFVPKQKNQYEYSFTYK